MTALSMKRLFDVLAAAALLAVFLAPMAVIALAVKLTSRGPALHRSARVGRNNVLFRMPKFRTMRVGAPQVATHLLADADRHITPLGSLLRKTSLDELPQLWCILRGTMSFVGPRPALFNQHDLVALRTSLGVHRLTPGLTGLAQINGRDELSIPDKVEFDRRYLETRSFVLDLRILAATAVKALTGAGVAHAAAGNKSSQAA
jgi:O-antigen biosynthesis protein WbqP